MKTIAIVGFGFCGKMVFANLIKSLKEDRKILIFDNAVKGFANKAFASFSPHYILNVPANKMSAFAEDQKDFCQFLEKKYPKILEEITDSGFAPRQIYGEYLEQILTETFALAKKKKVDFELINQEVSAIDKNKSDEEFLLKTKNNQQFKVDEVVLATSFIQTEFPWKLESKNLLKNLWDENSLSFHQKNFSNEKICLVGSGLTAVDVIIGLKKKNFAGKIFVISRRGNFPKKHFDIDDKPSIKISVDDAKQGVLFLCLKVRNFLRANPKFDLCQIIDSARSSTQELWHNFDKKNKKLFLRFFPYWNIFRHRAPRSSIEIIEEMINSGQLEIKKGGVKSFSKNGAKILIETRSEKFESDYLVNCLGFEFNAKKYPLLNQMISRGLLKPDLMMVRSNHQKIHLLGGLNIGKDFECTAVPDLRVQVERLIPILCLD
ncbi:MAG: hypothetical protein EBS06_00345 [Proteobacteria bacterium]|nr:hypothetical protein [Pseudomonadota bacterium]